MGRYQGLRSIYQTFQSRDFSSFIGSSIRNGTESWGYSSSLYKLRDFHDTSLPHITSRRMSSCIHNGHGDIHWMSRDITVLRSIMMQEPISQGYMRSAVTQAQVPTQARKMGAVKIAMLSPGIIYEPYAPSEKIPFWKRWFTRSGWKRMKEGIIAELKSAYAIAKLRKTGYSKQKFYAEASSIFKEINTQLANGGKIPLRKLVTEKMYSALKNEIKQRESRWHTVYWELIEPIVKVRTLRARLIGVDRTDLNKVFIQLTLEFLSKQKFEACDAKGAVVAGDRNKEVLVRDIWVFEKSLFHPDAYWRLCGRIKL